MASKLRIAKWEMVLMVVVALIIDVIDLLLEAAAVGVIADSILSVGAWLMYYIWFKVRGVKFGSRSALRMGVTTAAELIPVVNALPAWTAGIIWTLSAVIAEDELGIPIPGAGGVGAATKGKTGLSKPPPLPSHAPSTRDLSPEASPALGRRSPKKPDAENTYSSKKPSNVVDVDFDEEDEESLAA